MQYGELFTMDFETTGVDSTTCHPIEVALLSSELSYSSLIACPVEIPVEASAVHHIIAEDLVDAPSWEVVRQALAISLVSSDGRIPIIVAHKAEYEKNVLIRADLPPFVPVIWICTYKAALRVWPDAPGYKNEVLRYWLRLGTDRGRSAGQSPHSAMHDAQVTFLLLQALLEHATIEQLVEWTEQPAKLPRMPMGKYYGQAWDTIPAPYLDWICKQQDMRPDVKFCAEQELKKRRGR